MRGTAWQWRSLPCSGQAWRHGRPRRRHPVNDHAEAENIDLREFVERLGEAGSWR